MAAAKATAAKTPKLTAASSKASAGTRKTTPKERTRRSPAQLLADLRQERDQLAQKMGARLAKLEARITRVEHRYDTQIRLAQLADGASLDDLERQLEEAKRQQKLLRLALKTKR